MKIGLVGSAPSSVGRAPYGDPSWQFWCCSPAVYYQAGKVDAWFELHRWEPPVIGKPQQQRQWLSPEYCQWMSELKVPVWMAEKVPEIPSSRRLPREDLVGKYGHFFFTSSLAWMCAMAIETILINRELLKEGKPEAFPTGPEGDQIGFWGVDMAATEEYGYQRAGCQFFATLASSMSIKVVIPPESDLMIPPALYGISESTHRHIKLTARKEELLGRKAMHEQQVEVAKRNLDHVNGALDDMNYHLGMWLHEGAIEGTKFEDIFPATRVAEVVSEVPVPAADPHFAEVINLKPEAEGQHGRRSGGMRPLSGEFLPGGERVGGS